MPRPVLIVAASVEEIWPFVKSCRFRRRLPSEWGRGWQVAGPTWQAVTLLSGMGGAKPAKLTARAIDQWRPGLLIVAGFGGALTPLPAPTEVMVATACYTWRGDNGLMKQDLPLPALATQLVAALRQCGVPAHDGTAITTPGVTLKAEVLPLVRHLTNPVVDLESANLAAVAQANGVPCLVVRAITDGAAEEIQAFLAAMINQYHEVPLRWLLPALLARPGRLRYILHLWRRSRQASRHLALALHGLLQWHGANRGIGAATPVGH